jgi:hypothetical protein
MKRLIGLLALLFIFLIGCTQEGTLIIENDSIDGVWYELNDGDIELLSSGESDTYTWELSNNISNEDTKEIVVYYGGGYWFFYNYYVEVEIQAGETETITIIGDAGEIEVWNDSSSFVIMYVYLSPSSDETWGEDDLGLNTIGSGGSVVWKAESGFWDVKLVDNWGDEFISLNNYIAPEERSVFYYNGFRKTKNAVAEKLANSKKNVNITKDMIEKR